MDWLHAKATFWKVDEFSVVLEQLVGPDPLHHFDRFSHVRVAFLIDMSGARRGELLRHPARADADVQPPAREVIPGRELCGHTPGAR